MTTASFYVTIINDSVVEHDEKFELIIKPNSLPRNVIIGSPSRVTVILRNDDGKYARINT